LPAQPSAVAGPHRQERCVNGTLLLRRLSSRTRQRCAAETKPSFDQAPVQGDSFLGSSRKRMHRTVALTGIRSGDGMLRAKPLRLAREE